MKKIIVIILALVTLSGIGYIGYRNVPNRNADVGSEVYFDDSAKVMYFHSPLCTSCQEQKIILKKLAREGLRVRSMDIQKNPEYVSKYKIFVTPTFIAANGDKITGPQSEDELRVWLSSHK